MNLCELTVRELIEKLDKNEITPEEITKSYIDRINEKEKDINAFVTLTDKEALEKSKNVHRSTLKFAGIPIWITDNINTKGVGTTLLLNVLAGHDKKDSTSANEPKKDYKQGLPIGMQIIGKRFDEETILKTAYGQNSK